MTLVAKIGLSLLTISFLSASPASTIYAQKCASCHGTNGATRAMSKSKAIKGMPAIEIENAMSDYAFGTRKAMPFIQKLKKDVLNKYSKEEIQELAKYINKL